MDDREILRRLTEDKDFIRRLFVEDDSDNWALAKEWAELVLRIDPEDLARRLALVRAYRHLGDTGAATKQLAKCRAIIEIGGFGEVEREVILPMVEEEGRLLLLSP